MGFGARSRGMLWRMTGRPEEGPGVRVPERTSNAAGQADEDRMIALARQGDREAFDGLVERHLQHVWAVVWRIVHHREDAEDVVQEVFLAAFQGLSGYRGESRLSTWLHRIAVTRALNHLDRSEERMRRLSESLEEQNVDGGTGIDGGPAWPSSAPPSPLQALEARDLARRLSKCMGRLPAPWRAIIALRDIEAHSYEEIAGLVGVALGTVRSRLARARLALRQCVAGETS